MRNEDITIYGDGTQRRTFCYVSDNVDTCIEALKTNAVINEVINVGGEEEIKIIDLAKKIIEITNSSSNIIHLPPLKEGDMTRRLPDNSKMKKILKRDLLSLDEGILKTYEKLTL